MTGFPKLTRSLRFRLTAWFTLALGAVLASTAFAFYHVAKRTLRAETDAYLMSRARALLSSGGEEAGTANELGELAETISARRGPDATATAETPAQAASPQHFLLFDTVFIRLISLPSGRIEASSPSLAGKTAILAALDRIALRPGDASGSFAFAEPGEEETLRVLTLPSRMDAQNVAIQVAVPWDRNADVIERLVLLMSAVMAGILVAIAIGGWMVIGRTLHPIDRVVTEAQKLDPTSMPTALLPPPAESDSEIGHLVITLNDMTTRLHDAFETQRQFAESQQRFAADASHELRTPLTVLRGGLELALSRTREAADYRSALASAIEEVERMSTIVEGLSILARDGADTLDSAKSEVRLSMIASEAIGAFSATAMDREIEVTLSIELDATVLASQSGVPLRRMIANLVDNAMKYTQPGGSVIVTITGGTVVVTDTGIGIAAEDIPQVFGRFWRARDTQGITGSGLGLAICQQIVKDLGGEIHIASQLGAGTTVTVSLPVVEVVT